MESGIGCFYDLFTGDEDARVCKDIPESACNDQPYNFFSYLFANLMTKFSDELVSARLTLPLAVFRSRHSDNFHSLSGAHKRSGYFAHPARGSSLYTRHAET